MDYSTYKYPCVSLLIAGALCVIFCAFNGFAQGKSDLASSDPFAKSAPHHLLRRAPTLMNASLDEAVLDEGFNGTTFPPQGWNRIVQNINHYTYSWYRNTGDPYEGDGYACVQYDSALVPQDEWLISPAIDMTVPADSWKVTFFFLMSYIWSVSPNDNYDLELRISTDGGTSWLPDVLWVEDNFGVFPNWVWKSDTVDISDYEGSSNVKIAFRYVGVDGAEASLDAVKIEAVIIDPNLREYPSTSAPVAVADQDSNWMNMTINDVYTIYDLDVTLNFTHSYISDMSFWLKGPSNRIVQLVQTPESTPSGSNLVNTRFDDEASAPFNYVEGHSDYSGSWKPFEPLSGFDGGSTQGIWSLIATDNAEGDSGTIDNFTLHIRIAPEAADEPAYTIPTSVAFHGCYPNPFNPITTLSFNLVNPSPVRLQLFNTLGQQMTTLIDGNMNAGSHQIIFDGSNFASGTYFAILRAGDFVETRKIVLLK
jgi:subtilisin-like proprotein convertase family protein